MRRILVMIIGSMIVTIGFSVAIMTNLILGFLIMLCGCLFYCYKKVLNTFEPVFEPAIEYVKSTSSRDELKDSMKEIKGK